MIGSMDEETRRKIYDTPGVAMCDGKIVHRWEHSGNSHWIVGSKRTFGKATYKLTHIQTTPNLIFLFCERA